MLRKSQSLRWFVGAVLLAAVEAAGVAAVTSALVAPAQAQDSYPFFGRQRQPRQGGFFQGLFGPQPSQNEPGPSAQPSQPSQADYARAPNPRKPDTKTELVKPTTSIVVMGDGMADWLAYGLEDAFSDTPEIGILRKDRTHSGLLRYEYKSDLDWWHVARDTLAQEKADYVVMMLGVSDHQNIREKDLAKEAEKKAKDEKAKNEKAKNEKAKDDKAKDEKAKDAKDKTPANPADANKSAQNPATPAPDAQSKDQPDEIDQSSIVAPEPAPGHNANGIIEFGSEQWAGIYSRRIDETIAALKSKGVPVFWVGLPAIRGPKATADALYLNNLFRTRAERAGAVYIDVWDGFVDEAGKYATFGPDYEGQMRRLRSPDGVYFTKAGARKLAHYVEREIRRYMSNRALPVLLPSGPVGPESEGKSAARPLAGPVLPLTVIPGNSDELAGGVGARPAHEDSVAASVLVKGEPLAVAPGRADNFAWPQGSAAKPAGPAAAAPAATKPVASAAPKAALSKPVEAKAVEAKPIELKPVEALPFEATPDDAKSAETKPGEPKTERRNGAGEKITQSTSAKPKPRAEEAKPQRRTPPRPEPFPPGGPFGWLR
jgi:hypothetical protein